MFDKAKRLSTFLVVRGLLALVFGVLVLALPPGAIVEALVWVFGIFALVDGLFAIVASLAAHETMEDWWLLLLAGIFGVLIGVFTFARPGITAIVLVIYIGLRALITGVLEISFAIRLRRHIAGEWLFIVAGGLSVLFGLALIVWPVVGILAVVWLIGIYAIAAGAMQLVLAGQVHHWVRHIEERKSSV
jgi:uncharacterized membrane protein HdeD (DUF308 family)